MNRQQLAMFTIVLIAACSLSAVSRGAPGHRSDSRIEVKFRPHCLSEALTAVPWVKGATLDADSTGVLAVDEIVREYGSASVRRPYSFYPNQTENELAGTERWFEFRFDHPIAIEELGSRLQALREVETIEFVIRVTTPNVRVGSD
jgi:hypothetical protein